MRWVRQDLAVRGALAGIDASRHSVIYLGNPTVGARGLYSTIVSALGGIPGFHRASLIPQATEALATEEHERGRRVVLIFDEAHLLDADQLEGLRLLSGAEMDVDSPFACLLVGQPTLRRRIRLGCVRRPRSAGGAALRHGGDGTGRDGRLRRPPSQDAGRTDTLFSDDALALIHQVLRGLPRAVNNLAVQSLVAAFAESKAIVDESSTRAAITEVTAE